MLGIERVAFRFQRLNIIAFIGRLKDLGDLGHPVGDFVHAGLRFSTGLGPARPIGVEILGLVIGDMGGQRGLHPGELGAEFGDLGLMRQLLGGKVHGKIAIEPAAFTFGREEVALNSATAGDIFGFAQKAGDGMIGREAFFGNRAADRLGIVGLPARRQALPGCCLPLTVAS